MIKVDEEEPVGEVELSFPYRDVQIKRGIDPKEFYDLEDEIGRGKFGTVYKCREKSTNLALAAKFVVCPKKEDRRNVEREVEIMRSLQHPRLLQIYDAFENGKTMSVILELIEGGELFERVIDDDFILTEKSCTVFMRQICEGVGFIHKQGVLHLDMKPENILCLTKTGNRIKIIDFGLARRYDPSKKLQVLFGTPEFVAPEVVNFDQIGYGTDMWSVGVICYVLLSGLSPFMGATDIETMANVTIAKYDFDDEAFKDISENAKDFIAKLLVKDMENRMTCEECLNHVWLKKKDLAILETNATSHNGIISNMDMAKDNLKLFVERWNEHPNSPYVYETSSELIVPPLCPIIRRTDSLHSLEVCTPSPCQSINSSIISDEDFFKIDESNSYLSLPEHIRRASDSTCVTRGPDVGERVNLADEIRKLTDKLFQLSNMPQFGGGVAVNEKLVENKTINGNKDNKYDSENRESEFESLNKNRFNKDEVSEDQRCSTKDEPSSQNHVSKGDQNHVLKNQKHTTKRDQNLIFTNESSPHSQNELVKQNHETKNNRFHAFKDEKNVYKNESSDVNNFGVPWRRQKFKISTMSRDVPLQPKYVSTAKQIEKFFSNTNDSYRSNTINVYERSLECGPLKTARSVKSITERFEGYNVEADANDTKDVLLKLLQQWNESKTHRKPVSRHGSIATDWLRRESVGQTTISSINNFFQMRATKKASHIFDES